MYLSIKFADTPNFILTASVDTEASETHKQSNDTAIKPCLSYRRYTMQRLRHFLNQKTFKIRNVYLVTSILTVVFLTIYGTTRYHFEGEAIKREHAKFQRSLDEILAGEQQQRETAPILDNPLQPKGNDSGTITAKYNPNNPQGKATMTQSKTEPVNVFTYRYETGIYQGMTFGEAYTAWKAKKSEIYERYFANAKVRKELTKALLDSSKAERSTMLSFLKNLSPEDLAASEEELIKAYPKESDELKSFFQDIANATPKSLDEIIKDADFILKSDEVNKIARKENHAEFLKINQELDQVDSEKPTLPNLP